MAVVLIANTGNREHGLSLAYEKSSHVNRIVHIGDNDFLEHNRGKEVVVEPGDYTDPAHVLRVAERHCATLVDVQQENALAGGIVDTLQAEGFTAFGPSAAAARIESDKVWARELMRSHDIPHPNFTTFSDVGDAEAWIDLEYQDYPDKVHYIKASGLAGGKGAMRASSLEEALHRLQSLSDFGEAGERFVVEDGMQGEEFSYFVICDGKNYRAFRSSQDNKSIDEFGEGDNTGGMGVNTPALVTDGLETTIVEQQVERVLDALNRVGAPFTGILYVGGMVVDGKVYNVEYNCRWGDPECQTILPGLKTDYFELVSHATEGRLDEIDIVQDALYRVNIVGAARGYPGDYSQAKNKEIFGIDRVMSMPGVRFTAGGISIRDGRFYTNGSRVFNIIGEGVDPIDAKIRAEGAMGAMAIEGNNLVRRFDIGNPDQLRTYQENR